MYRFKQSHGAISVFLVIILVPCLLASSMFVDLSRVFLSKSVAEASADLALNTLMTNYDAELSEWYGMVASCQNIDEFYQGSAEYFLRMLKSQNMTDDEIFLVSDYFAHAVGDDTIYDLLQIESQTEAGDIVKPVTGADMTNASIIRTQVVEFMKYRGPITAAETIIEKLKSPDSGASDLIESTKNEDLVDSKQEYYKAEGELLEKSFYSYWAIREYSDKKVTNPQLQGELDKLKAQREIYREAHQLMVKNFYNTQGLKVFKRPVPEMPTGYNKENVRSYEKEETESSDSSAASDSSKKKKKHYYVKNSDITSKMNSLKDAITAFEEAKAEVETKGNEVFYDENSVYAIQYWKQLNDKINQSGGPIAVFEKKAKDMLDLCAYVDAMTDCENDPDSVADDSWRTEFAGLKDKVEDYQDRFLTEGVTEDDDYLKLVGRLEKISKENIDEIDPAKKKLSNGETVGAAIGRIAREQAETKERLQEYIELLNTAIEGDKDKIPSMDELKTLVAKYSTSHKTWKNTADSTDTQMGEEDRALIAGNGEVINEKIKKDGSVENINQLSPACQRIAGMGQGAVSELKTRLSGIRTQIQNVLDTLESMKYGGEQLYNIKDYESFKTKASSKVSSSQISLKKTELDNYAVSTFKDLFQPYSTSAAALAVLDNREDYNAQLDPKAGTVKITALYQFFYDEFGDSPKADVENTKNEVNGAKGEADRRADKVKNREVETKENITRSFSPKDTGFNVLSGGIKGIGGTIGKIIDGNFAAIRDDLYVGIYIMEMFSYDTFENEGLYGLVKEKDKEKLKKLTTTNCDKEYKKYFGDEKTKERWTWLSEDPQDSYNKTLTNKMINAQNNKAYQCEVEYILYGKDTSKANVDAAYGEIYGIRFGLNLISAFQNFWGLATNTGKTINSVSAALSAASGGIIPASVIKAVLLPILTVFETAMDIERLSKGFPVELYKASDDWVISLEGKIGLSEMMSKLTGSTEGKNKDKGLHYSEYLTIFVMLGISGEDTSAPMCQRMAEVMQANVQKITGVSSYQFSKAKVYFQIDADIRTKPIMVTLPIFSGYGNTLNEDGEWCKFKVSTKRGYL